MVYINEVRKRHQHAYCSKTTTPSKRSTYRLRGQQARTTEQLYYDIQELGSRSANLHVTGRPQLSYGHERSERTSNIPINDAGYIDHRLHEQGLGYEDGKK
eukprot:2799001-Amphidinium_carterae.3